MPKWNKILTSAAKDWVKYTPRFMVSLLKTWFPHPILIRLLLYATGYVNIFWLRGVLTKHIFCICICICTYTYTCICICTYVFVMYFQLICISLFLLFSLSIVFLRCIYIAIHTSNSGFWSLHSPPLSASTGLPFPVINTHVIVNSHQCKTPAVLILVHIALRTLWGCLWHINPEVEFLDHKLYVYIIFCISTKVLSSLYFYLQCMKIPLFWFFGQ